MCFFKFFNKQSITNKLTGTDFDYAVIVTAYQQTTLIPMVVDSILKANYTNYIIYVVADNCDVSHLNFTDNKVVVLKPEEVLASNTKSHFYAIDRFQRDHEIITIIDSDNLVHPEYFIELNKFISAGYTSVQGVRAAKNLNTPYACLDEAGDIFYRLIDRKLLFEAGSSAALSGSGMAFTTTVYRDCLEHTLITGAGFDKILQYEILNRGYKIAFAEKAIVYDEKTSKTGQLVNQRSRWLNTWFKYFFLGLNLFGKSIVNFNLNQGLFSLMLLRPPLFILLILSATFFVLDLFFIPLFSIYWILGAIVFIVSVFSALKYFKADKRIYSSLKNVHKFMYYQVLALLKVRKANKISVATEHYYKEEIKK
ncbi:glycosyltransferase family 2 protein [Pedobacter panaciterrae]|uniref:Glycosyltransferase family 2 protein n=1 Tax=Pedobacter panaciterrae TaxID=363849 RepID=A0ABU8NF43_9SPHI